MAQNDWSEVSGVAGRSSIERGVAPGLYIPPSGSNCYRFTSLDNGTGCVARYLTVTGANPTTKGGQISAAMQRGLSAGQTDFSIFVYMQLTNPSVAGVAYMLGLTDGGHVVLRKGNLAGGLPNVAAGSQGVLARSSVSYPDQSWVHLMLEACVNGNGDVVLNCYGNDLSLNSVGAPSWVRVTGMDKFIDDPIGVNSGSPPLTAGRMGFGFRSADVARVALIDAVRPMRQV